MRTETTFPPGRRRVLFYLFYDVRGVVDDYIPYKLERLRPFADHIVAIVNGIITAESRGRLAAVTDEIFQRENVGFDAWGYKEALDAFGEDRLADYDEVLLVNYTWFGPVRDLAPLFTQMDGRELDFWGITDHGAVESHPRNPRLALPVHIQSHWIAVRRRMVASDAWRRYWRDMPRVVSYDDSITRHETRFTPISPRPGSHGQSPTRTRTTRPPRTPRSTPPCSCCRTAAPCSSAGPSSTIRSISIGRRSSGACCSSRRPRRAIRPT
ncbi:hypothetical protein GCM10025881_10740 [Pseudolysinimonas kribbensis]|uniref:Uncharacterized protein n=1 Tax=Pseudolysinimonas kribbensis TaxID=433641 RepID=A0ABQ6K3V2_9MICO|nr:hypothetical protein GCM10025881_10740 [Pseudolysinimonas kribbensis]